MSLTLEHFSHPKHPLVLKEYDVIEDDAICYICNKTVAGSPMYTCSISSDDTKCQSFYLHKCCAELPTRINFYKHNQHPLDLIPTPHSSCDVCYYAVKFAYICCDDCRFCVCVFCAFQQRALDHPGHKQHTLTLMKREALFTCDACSEEAKDSSYVCTTCDFWIHKECAFSLLTITAPTYHHHPLNLIYSIPKIHRYFKRRCNICSKLIQINFWLYYCHKCTYFVHMKCATSSHTASIREQTEAEGIDNEPNLVQFPLHSEESLFDLIITQCSKLQVEYQSKGKKNIAILKTANDPHLIKKHWSHKEHPLLQFTISENDNCDRKVLICDGCIQPITVSHPSYYACTQCGFFLHSFCATKLPNKLVAGASPFHPQHSLFLRQQHRFYSVVKCGVCCHNTNGFYYRCKTCDITVDIRCAFLPSKIKHKSHKHHSLIQRPSSGSRCSVSKYLMTGGSMEYGCETCITFQIDIDCAFYPSRMKHKFDHHPITLRHPPFFYEGVIYCEICEEQVNNQYWLYHCGECDHSFHYDCHLWLESVKMGGTIELDINDQSHTLTLVLKRRTRKNSPGYFCKICGDNLNYFFECDGCGYLICPDCVRKSGTSNKSVLV